MINLNNLDFVLLNESYIHVEVKIDAVSTTETDVTDYLIPFFLSEIRLEMNGVLVDSVKSPGICTAIMKSLTLDESEKIASTLGLGNIRKTPRAISSFLWPICSISSKIIKN